MDKTHESINTAAPLRQMLATPMQPGIVLAHKRVGRTSFAVVREFLTAARAFRDRKTPAICHGGVLDPFAEGLLLVLVGAATRLFDYLHDVPKVYEAVVRWGIETDNGDPTGRIVSRGDASSLTPERLAGVLAGFVGWQDQTPPATSNKRIGSERAYEKARRGETVTLPPTRVYLHEAAWIEHRLPEQSHLRIVARGGYYVRSLARDLGRTLGCFAHLAQLRRLSIGPWHDPGPDGAKLIMGRDLLPWLPARMLDDSEVGALRRGESIFQGTVSRAEWTPPAGFPTATEIVRGPHGQRLKFLLKRQTDRLAPLTHFGRGL